MDARSGAPQARTRYETNARKRTRGKCFFYRSARERGGGGGGAHDESVELEMQDSGETRCSKQERVTWGNRTPRPKRSKQHVSVPKRPKNERISARRLAPATHGWLPAIHWEKQSQKIEERLKLPTLTQLTGKHGEQPWRKWTVQPHKGENTLLKPKRHSLRCHGFMVHALPLRMHTNVVYFRVMRKLCRREWNWLWNWRCVNLHPWQRTRDHGVWRLTF